MCQMILRLYRCCLEQYARDIVIIFSGEQYVALNTQREITLWLVAKDCYILYITFNYEWKYLIITLHNFIHAQQIIMLCTRDMWCFTVEHTHTHITVVNVVTTHSYTNFYYTHCVHFIHVIIRVDEVSEWKNKKKNNNM